MNSLETRFHSTDLSRLQRKERIHQLKVRIPTHQHALKTLEACMEGSSYSAEPKSVFIGGDSGMGKTTLIEAFKAQHPDTTRKNVDSIPVLVASIPSSGTTKSTASSLLKGLGDPKAFNGELARLTDRLLTYLKACEVKMIVLDEFQHIIDRESSKVRAGTADWLKTVVNESKVPLALVGLPSSEVILNENIQLDRRFHRRLILPRFSYSDSDGRASFRMLLKLIDENLPFAVSAGLDEPKTAEWLFECSRGLLGFVMSIIREAAEMAVDEMTAQIQRSHLQAAHENNRSKMLSAENELSVASSEAKRVVKNASIGEILRS